MTSHDEETTMHLTPGEVAQVEALLVDPDKRAKDYWAAMHTGGLISSVEPVMRLADTEQANLRAKIECVEEIATDLANRAGKLIAEEIAEPETSAAILGMAHAMSRAHDDLRAALADVPRPTDDELAERIEWATGGNGRTVLRLLRDEGLAVVAVKEAQR